MREQSRQVITFQSQTNPKVKVNLSFETDSEVAARAQQELYGILKSLYIEKYLSFGKEQYNE